MLEYYEKNDLQSMAKAWPKHCSTKDIIIIFQMN